MEEIVKEQQQAGAGDTAVAVVLPGKSKLRYPLRSATKVKEEKTPVSQFSSSSASKRGRPVSSVSKSVGVLDLSGNDKSAKPPRRLSIPVKSGVAAGAKPVGTITPISEARGKRSAHTQGKSETPLSDFSRTSSRITYNRLAAAAYWLSQIKLSESAAKHSISLGFFKLALEAGCEPLQRMRDELKSYVRRHDLSEIAESVKELFENYNIADNQEQLQVSESCSQVPDEGTRSSDDEVRSSSSTMGTRKLTPRSLNSDSQRVPSVSESAKKEVLQKNTTATRTRASQNKNTARSRFVSESTGRQLEKKPQRPNKQEASKEKDMMKKQGRKPVAVDKGSVSPPTAANAPEEDKENMDAPPMEEVSQTEVS